MTHRLTSASTFLTSTSLAFLLACGPGVDTPSTGTASGGATGTPGSGGSSSTGGAANSGGAPGSGGAVTTSGGAPGSGGAPATGGRVGGTGGAAVGSGGATGTGGSAGGAGGRGTGGAAGGTASGGGGGASATGGAAGGGGPTGPAKPSAGCGMATTQAAAQWVQSNVMSGTSTRPYSVRLPTGYDPKKAYPVIVLLHGCGSGTNNVPMEKTAGSDAILIRGTGSAADTCWGTTANGADVMFVDAMIADVKARFCSDENRFFAVGYSSGSWLANQLTCIRSTVLRGAGTVTGGESASGTCKGPVSRIFIHDKDDTTNVISGSERARDRQLTQNGCDKSMAPVATTPSPCVRYPGCPAEYPVVWCATSGNQHGRQDATAPTIFWNFFKQF